MKFRKSVRKTETKSRSLRVFTGKRTNDLLYWAKSGSFYSVEKSRLVWNQLLEQWYTSGLASRATLLSFGWPMGSEQITTTDGNRDGFNDCTHIKQMSVCLPFTMFYESYNLSTTIYRIPYWRRATASPYWRDASNVALSVGYQDSQSFSARAYWSMRPKFHSEASLINSIFELKDFSDVANTMFGQNKTMNMKLRTFYRNLKQANKLFNKTPVGSTFKGVSAATKLTVGMLSQPSRVVAGVTKLAAQAQLTWALAVLPTVRDAITIHSTAQKDFYDEARRFKQFGEDGARSHFSEHDTIFNSVVPSTYNNYVYGEGKFVKKTSTATMHSYYRVLWQRFEDLYPNWWGLEAGIDEIWNMLPLSFVLDYIWTIGKSLEYMDRDDKVQVLSTRYCESVKVVATSGSHIMYDTRVRGLALDGVIQPPPSVKLQPLLVTGTSGTYYNRVVKSPYKGPALPKFKVPSSAQTANLLALARCLIF